MTRKFLLWMAFLVGLMADAPTLLTMFSNLEMGSDFYLFWSGFLFLLPLSVWIVITFFEKLQIKNAFLIIFSSVVITEIVSFLGWWLADVLQGIGNVSDMYGAIYPISGLAALIIGIIFGVLEKKYLKNKFSYSLE